VEFEVRSGIDWIRIDESEGRKKEIPVGQRDFGRKAICLG
jgi:hypothetical protein